jgi:hypothetical protein
MNKFAIQGKNIKSDWREGIKEGERGIARYNAEQQVKSAAILSSLKADEDKLEFITPKSATLTDENGLELSESEFMVEFAEVL